MALHKLKIVSEAYRTGDDYGAIYLSGYFERSSLGKYIVMMSGNEIQDLEERAKSGKGLKELFRQARGFGWAAEPTDRAGDALNIMPVDEVRYSIDAKTGKITTHLSYDTDGEIMRFHEGEGGPGFPFIDLKQFSLVKPVEKTPTAREIKAWARAYDCL